MPSYDYEYYTCPKCKARRTTKTCPDCAAKTKGQGRVSMRYRLINEYGEKRNMRTGWYDRKSDAEDEYTKVKATAPKVDYRTRDGESYLFEDLLIKYIASMALEIDKSTFYEKNLLIEKHIKPEFKGKDIRKITKQNLLDWQTGLFSSTYGKQAKQISNAHARKVRSALNGFLDWAEEYYDITNQLKHIKLPKKKTEEKVTEKEIIELREYPALDEATKDDVFWNIVFFFMFHSGVRPGEMRALSEVDYKDGEININKTITRKEKGKELVGQQPKNKKSYRKPIDNQLIARLDKYLAWKRENGISGKFLFGGDKFIDKHELQRKTDYYIEKAEIKKRITPHCFRHSYVSMLIDMDCSTKTVAEMIGDTEAVVMKTYSHLYTSKKRQTVDKLNTYLEQNSKTQKQNCT